MAAVRALTPPARLGVGLQTPLGFGTTACGTLGSFGTLGTAGCSSSGFGSSGIAGCDGSSDFGRSETVRCGGYSLGRTSSTRRAPLLMELHESSSATRKTREDMVFLPSMVNAVCFLSVCIDQREATSCCDGWEIRERWYYL